MLPADETQSSTPSPNSRLLSAEEQASVGQSHLTMNLPCGARGDPCGDCVCSAQRLAAFRELDRFDLVVAVPRTLPSNIAAVQSGPVTDAHHVVAAYWAAAEARGCDSTSQNPRTAAREDQTPHRC
jgi:hypothetical protein